MKSVTIKRMAQDEYGYGRYNRARMLNTLYYIIKQAENSENEDVWFTTEDIGHGDRIKGIVIRNISALNGMQDELGTNFNPVYMLTGMQAVTQDSEGYCMSVLTTHDLNSATIEDLSELVFRIRQIKD